MIENLADKVKQIVEERIREEERRLQKVKNREALERAKPKFLTGLKFLGATALLGGALVLGSLLINQIPEPTYSNKTERKESIIQDLRADNASYTRSIKNGQEKNNNLKLANNQLEQKLETKRKQRNIFGNVKNGYQSKATTTQTPSSNNQNKVPETTFNQGKLNQDKQETQTTTSTKEQTQRNTQQKKQESIEKIIEEKPVMYKLRMGGDGHVGTKVVIWKDEKPFRQATIGEDGYIIMFSHPEKYFIADSITGSLQGYATINTGKFNIPEDDNMFDFYLRTNTEQKEHDAYMEQIGRQLVEDNKSNRTKRKEARENKELNQQNNQTNQTSRTSNRQKQTNNNPQTELTDLEKRIQNQGLTPWPQNKPMQGPEWEAWKKKTMEGVRNDHVEKTYNRYKRMEYTSNRNGRKIMKKADYTLTAPEYVKRGEVLVIPAGTRIKGEENFEFIVERGGSLEIKGTAAIPVTLSSNGTWEGLTFINSQGNKISNCIIANVQDYDLGEGGAITAKGSQIEFNNVDIIKAYSDDNGGSIRAENSILVFKNGKLDGGQAKNKGGNIYLVNTSMDIISSEVINGKATDGGNIYVYNSKGETQEGIFKYPLFIDRSQINYGTATNKGGGVFVDYALIELQKTTATTNKARYGGGLYGRSSIYNIIKGSNFSRNQATIAGGGAYFEDMNIDDQKLRKAFTNNRPNNVIIK